MVIENEAGEMAHVHRKEFGRRGKYLDEKASHFQQEPKRFEHGMVIIDILRSDWGRIASD